MKHSIEKTGNLLCPNPPYIVFNFSTEVERLDVGMPSK
jgi:hypothetical protein